ncbi:MAG: orotidine-5'-phosphate decarboxylase [Candidatus Omnitrophica bacterium]|nr:orotidine-5'-phosphate decarboxylase [Candidatus Omnitrophota bacterium]HOX54078.1 orotidine-5'-phosphate decarboxylase [Candidatus Omnitrophota bacterium]
MLDIKDKLIVALDVDTLGEAEKFVDKLCPAVNMFKVGSQLFTACGPQAVQMITKKGAKVFLDLKSYDIPNTVKKAVEAASKLRVFMLTVHLSGGKEMLQAAASVPNRPKIVGVTILTSQSEDNTANRVLDLARLAKEAGLDGVVCSVAETKMIKKELGKDFLVVNPGIRPKDAQANDQKRVATPKEAIEAGADFIVMGRPILEAKDPLKLIEGLI